MVTAGSIEHVFPEWVCGRSVLVQVLPPFTLL
jgi:hypothetical protein